MSDAMTDINRDNEIREWMDKNVAPILVKFAKGETKENTLKALMNLIESGEYPQYRGYFSGNPKEIMVYIHNDIYKRDEDVARSIWGEKLRNEGMS
jgi:hypothetical protein